MRNLKIIIVGVYLPTQYVKSEDLDQKFGLEKGTVEKTTKVKSRYYIENETNSFMAKKAIEDGASEIDMVINIGALKDKEYDYVRNEIKGIKEAIGTNVLKVIIETCYLTEEEKVKACELSLEANADFVKTSTGFGTGGATYEDVSLMKKIVGDKAEVKASGGVKDLAAAKKYIELGATRLGTSSGIEILKGLKVEDGKY